MKNLIKLCLLTILIFSLSAHSSIKELTMISLSSGEIIYPSEQVESVNQKAIQLFNGRIIDTAEILNVEVMSTNGSSETLKKGLFKIININAVKISIGGDNSGGGWLTNND